MEKLVIAWDLDGTLIDSTHRVKFKEDGEFDLEEWIKSSEDKDSVFKDTLLPLSNVYFEFAKSGFTQICVTARNMTDIDFEYLSSNGLYFDMILHRGDSLELDEELKSRKLQNFLKAKGRIPFMAFDDKEENLKIFDNYGFRTFQAIYMNEKLKKDSFSDIKDVKPSLF